MAKKRFKKKAVKLNKILASDRYAVAAVDPGGTSGVFACVVDNASRTMKETAQGVAENETEILIGQITGDFRTQASEIATVLKDWYASQAMDYVAPANHYLVIENWDTMRKNPGREIISAWIAAGLDCLMTEGLNPIFTPEQITYFNAGQAKAYATNERLKLWNLYDLTRGKPHARDASRHWATRVNQLID